MRELRSSSHFNVLEGGDSCGHIFIVLGIVLACQGGHETHNMRGRVAGALLKLILHGEPAEETSAGCEGYLATIVMAVVGYPVFSAGGVMFQTQYSSLLSIGRYIELKTEVPWASGRYQLSTVRHELSSWVANGPWHSICTANRTEEGRMEAQGGNG